MPLLLLAGSRLIPCLIETPVPGVRNAVKQVAGAWHRMKACVHHDDGPSTLKGYSQSSIHHGHQLRGLLCVVPFLITLIFISLPFCS